MYEKKKFSQKEKVLWNRGSNCHTKNKIYKEYTAFQWDKTLLYVLATLLYNFSPLFAHVKISHHLTI